MPERYLSRPTAAKYAGVSTATLDRMIRSGELPAIREGNRVLVDRDDIDAHYEAKKSAGLATLATA
jgi:excisionase family DNA binding protein